MLRVWLPPSYKTPDQRSERYPVIYLNDGQDLFDACTSIFNAQECASMRPHYLLRGADRFAQWPEKVFIGVGSISEPVDDVHRLQHTLQRRGLGIPRLLVVEQPGAAHNEEAWAQRFPRALQFLYSRPIDQ
jgi:predicted alpha/beta superfamily hydrolase